MEEKYGIEYEFDGTYYVYKVDYGRVYDYLERKFADTYGLKINVARDIIDDLELYESLENMYDEDILLAFRDEALEQCERDCKDGKDAEWGAFGWAKPKKNMKYEVRKGSFTYMGEGNYLTEGAFDSLEEARKLFNKIKKDEKGYLLDDNHYVETIIIDLDKEANFELDDIVDSYHYTLFKKGTDKYDK